MLLNQNKTAEATKVKILANLCNQINLEKQRNNSRIPYGYMSSLVASHKTVYPWLICNESNNYLRCRMQVLIILILLTSAAPEITAVMDITVANTEVTKRIKGVRPAGSKDKKKQHCQLVALVPKTKLHLSIRRRRRIWLRSG